MVSAVQREPEPRAKPLATEPLLKPAKEEPRECLPNNADAGNFCAELPLSRDANNSLRRMLMLQSSTIFRAADAQSAVGATQVLRGLRGANNSRQKILDAAIVHALQGYPCTKRRRRD